MKLTRATMVTRKWGRRWALGLVLGLALPATSGHGASGDKDAWIAHHKKLFYTLQDPSFASVSCQVTSSALDQMVSDLRTQRDKNTVSLSIYDNRADFRLVFEKQGDRLSINAPQIHLSLQDADAQKHPERAKDGLTIITARFEEQVREVREVLQTLFEAYRLSPFEDRARVTFEPTPTGYTAQHTSKETQRVVKTIFADGARVEETQGARDLVRTRTTYVASQGEGLIVETLERQTKAKVPRILFLTVKHQTLQGVIIPSDIRVLIRTAIGHEPRSVEQRITLSSCTVKR
jgi:hypothetical protein